MKVKSTEFQRRDFTGSFGNVRYIKVRRAAGVGHYGGLMPSVRKGVIKASQK